MRALKRLVGHGPKNRFYRATRELGRVFKTEFILDYLSQPALRTRIRRGLGWPDDLNFELLSHISPIGWDNVLLYGEYQLNRSLVRSERFSV